MRSVISGLAAVAALCASAAVGIAQQAGYQLEPGTRIRLVTPKLPASDRIVRVVAIRGDTIAFRSELSSTIQSLPLSDVEAVEVSMGHRRHVLRGAGMGLLGGAGLGGVVGLVAFEPCEPSCEILAPTTRAQAAAMGVVIGGAVGLVVGTTIGGSKRTEKWQRIQPSTRVGFMPARGGAVVSVSRAF